ncbi:MAG: cytochrome c, partial [Verrucomicrobiota bacterium]
ALLDGINSTAPQGKTKNTPRPKILYFATEPPGYAALAEKPDKNLAEQLEKTALLVSWPGQPGYVAPPVVPPLTATQQKQFALGKDLFAASCAICHQLTGFGMEGLAPPLADSEWVLGSPHRIARIILHGLRGTITVKGKSYDMEMPSLNVFDDDQIAAILTYIRREWEHGATPVEPSTIKKIRATTARRNEAWTEAELQKVP